MIQAADLQLTDPTSDVGDMILGVPFMRNVYTVAPWILHDMVARPHFQQFLQRGTPGFMFAPLMVAIKFPTLKHRLISIFVFLPLWTSQMSIHTSAMSDFGETLITLGFEAREILSKMWFCLRIFLMSSDESLVCQLSKYGK